MQRKQTRNARVNGSSGSIPSGGVASRPGFNPEANSRALVARTRANLKAGKGRKPTPRAPPKEYVPECVKKFATARLVPFHPKAYGACLPGANNTPSMKYSTTINTTISATTAGHAIAISIRPGAASDSPSLYYYSYDPAVVPNPTMGNIFTSGTLLQAVGAPFASASFGSGTLEQRLVGMGVRIKTAEAALTCAGVITGYFETDPLGVGAGTAKQTIEAKFNCRKMIKTQTFREWFILEADCDEAQIAQQWVNSSGYLAVTSNTANGAIFVPPSDATSTVSLLVEFVAHWEVRGSTVSVISSPNEDGSYLFSRVYSAISSIINMAGPMVVHGARYLPAILSSLASRNPMPLLLTGLAEDVD